MQNAQQRMTEFANKASTVVLAAGTALGAGLAKLAADAEILNVKFKVLLGSGDAAAAMMNQINTFAAETPFQKMDIATAAQKLLAFNIPAGEVVEKLRQIGDIAALTGVPIGELSEIYGKANVSGRLFAEDMNQLLGRGINVTAAFAEQFGVAESEVKGLVSAGQVTATHLSKAFQMMTTGSGAFAGGMKQLSKTTAGQFSTLIDNVTMLGTQMGKHLLPVLNKGMEIILSLVKGVQGWSKALVILGSVLVATAGFYKMLTVATKQLAAAKAFLLALQGWKGIAQVGVAAAAAAIAVGVMASAVNDVAEETKEANAELKGIEAQAPRAGNAFKKMAEDASDLADKVKAAKQAMLGMASPHAQLNAKVAEFAKHLQHIEGLGPIEAMLKLREFREQESGFTGMMKSVVDDIRILKGEATATSIELEKMAAVGIAPFKIEELRKAFQERARLEKAQEQEKEQAQKAVDVAKENLSKAKQKLSELARIPDTVGFQARGSQEAMKTILGATAKKDAATQAAESQVSLLEDLVDVAEKQLQETKEKFEIQGAI